MIRRGQSSSSICHKRSIHYIYLQTRASFARKIASSNKVEILVRCKNTTFEFFIIQKNTELMRCLLLADALHVLHYCYCETNCSRFKIPMSTALFPPAKSFSPYDLSVRAIEKKLLFLANGSELRNSRNEVCTHNCKEYDHGSIATRKVTYCPFARHQSHQFKLE